MAASWRIRGVLAAAMALGSCSSSGKQGAGGAAGAPAGSTGGSRGGATTGSTGGATGGATGGLAGGATGGSTGGAAGHATGGSPGGSSGAGAGTGGAGGRTGVAWNSAFPSFTKHSIASFADGYAVAIADVDADGKPDVVALSSGSANLVWFKNPSWTKYTITSKAKQLIYMAAYDVNGDGHLDMAVASDFSMTDTTGGGTISWAEAPADPTQNQEWTLHEIDAIPTAHRLRWADLDGDGRKELIALPIFGVGSMSPAYAGAVQLTAYAIPANPASDAWASQVLDSQHLEVAHGLAVVDWDGDKTQDLLTAANDGIDLFRPSLTPSSQHLGDGAAGQAPTKGSSEVGLGSLGGARFIATIEPWHGTDAVVYTPGTANSPLWNRQDLGADFTHGHGLGVADFNGDGYDEFVAGGGQGTMAQIIYRYVPSSGTWDKIPLDTGGVAVSGIDVGDLDGDGDVDIVSIGTSPTNNVVWYENAK
ncbi:MAG TPA: VCBS repeat-containing protein [Polyangia bacterium]|nr:VCBS repeat-containing protein [Polyangia bacterium]